MKPATWKLLMQIGTPALSDKRLLVAVLTEMLVATLMLLGIVPAESGVYALVTVALAFMGQSQAGLVFRTQALAAHVAQDADAQDVPADKSGEQS